MVNVYKEIDNKLIELNYNDEHLINADNIEEKTWIHIENPSNEMLVGLSKITNIPMTLLISALDEEESAHVDQEDNSFLIVLDVPFIDENDNITTKPFVIAYNDNYFITVSNYNKTLKDTILNKVKIVEPQKQIRMTLNFIYYLSKEFISILKIIDNKTKSIEKELYSSLKNEELFKMLAVNKTFVYISNGMIAVEAAKTEQKNPQIPGANFGETVVREAVARQETARLRAEPAAAVRAGMTVLPR